MTIPPDCSAVHMLMMGAIPMVVPWKYTPLKERKQEIVSPKVLSGPCARHTISCQHCLHYTAMMEGLGMSVLLGCSETALGVTWFT